ncbi:UNVERIFIED_CONTAM: hypothetical protein GTU68_047338 [Idotea baltica]|nr:hypothetical protein [Idotea baltica]
MANKKLSENTRAIVTGAGSGIGKAFALELAKRGGDVLVSDIDLDMAHATVAEIHRLGGRATANQCDVSKLEDVKSLAEHAQAQFNQAPNFVINNAGVALGGSYLEDISLEDWRWIMGVNFWGVVHGCNVFVPILRAQDEGVLLNVSSAASFFGAPKMGAYNASKAAVLGLTETLVAELSETGVSVAVMCPTLIKTDIVKNSRIENLSVDDLQVQMSHRGMEADEAITRALNGIDKGKIHLLPQLDARIAWFFKRLAPGLFTSRAMGFLNRKLIEQDSGVDQH